MPVSQGIYRPNSWLPEIDDLSVGNIVPSQSNQNAAILYRSESFDTGQSQLLGYQAASEGFLKGFIQHAKVDEYFCYAPANHLAPFKNFLAKFGRESKAHWLDESDPASPQAPGVLHLPNPALAGAAWRRRGVGQRLYSITGITHTTASAAAMDGIAGLLTSPVQEWDALICSSQSVRETIELVLDQQQEFLAKRLGSCTAPRPQLPVIPLGVDTHLLAPVPERRMADRAELGVAAGDVVVLFLGRLSFQSKAHPFAMYAGLEMAAQTWAKAGGHKVHLVQVGWFPTQFEERAIKAGAAQFCPSVNCTFLDGRKPEVRKTVWNAADLFTSLSDNIQETFGLTPVEAMAAGLPGVVSDWNGYRDTVRHGIDGLRVPTLMPRPGLGMDLADRFASGTDTYGVYCGQASQFVSVDIAAASQAYLTLFQDADLRKRMGASARNRACEMFDWSVVIGRYQDLWRELAERRANAIESAAAASQMSGNPARLDPFLAFSGYPTTVLSSSSLITLQKEASLGRFQEMIRSPLFAVMSTAMPNTPECAKVLAALEFNGALSVAEILRAIEPGSRVSVERGLVWMAKLGLLSIAAS
jgi:glycosyltransferase involved in cell wall biosynthesis